MKRSDQLKEEIASLIEIRRALTKRMSLVERFGDSLVDDYSKLTAVQLQLEADLDTYDERSRAHPDRMLTP
jgi:hypothetical protein